MTEILSIDNTAASTAEFTLGAGEEAHLFLKGANGEVSRGAIVQVQRKVSTGVFTTFATMSGQEPALIVAIKGTFRLHRPAQTDVVGIDIEDA
jgi:hypothetical protein